MTLGNGGMAERLERFFRGASAFGVVSAYLFGSHAEGRQHRDSDVDRDGLDPDSIAHAPPPAKSD